MASVPHPFMEEFEKRGQPIAVIMFNPSASDDFREAVMNNLPRECEGKNMGIGCLSAYNVWTYTQ